MRISEHIKARCYMSPMGKVIQVVDDQNAIVLTEYELRRLVMAYEGKLNPNPHEEKQVELEGSL